MLIRPSVRLLRVEESSRGTFGVLIICDAAFCVTLELPDRLNATNVSNIPDSQYVCKKIVSPTHGETFEVMNIPNRSRVLFHKGNIIANSRGCIILAQYFGKLYGDRAVMNSGKTFAEFLDKFKNIDEFSLTIKEVY